MPLVKIQNGDTGDVVRGKIDIAFDKIDQHDIDIASAQGDIVNLQTDVSAAQGDITLIQSQLNVNTGDVNVVQGDIVTLDNKVNVTEGKMLNIENVELPAIRTDIFRLKNYDLISNLINIGYELYLGESRYLLKNTSTSQIATITGSLNPASRNGRIVFYIQSGDITFSGGQNIIDTHGAGTYTAPAVVECLLIQGYLVIFDHLA